MLLCIIIYERSVSELNGAENEKIIVYDDESNNEFSGVSRQTISVNKKFTYIHKSLIWNILAFIVYRLIMMPVAFLYCKIKFSHRIVNKKVLKQCRKKGYFIYANHTMMGGDAFIPNLVNFPKKTYVVVHPDNLSVFGLKNFLQMNGAIPTPTDFHAKPNFLAALEKRSCQHNAVMIYPEAHIWPYYTGIRPFHAGAFEYPVKFRDPVYCFTNTFSAKRHGKTPKVTTYIDGPFYPDISLDEREAQEKLSSQVFEAMRKRSENNTYEAIKYVKKVDR